MIKITLPDSSVRQFVEPISALEVAKSIAASLAKATLVAKIDGELKDLNTLIENDCALVFITRDDDEALPILRHDCAHILAEAVQSLFPNVQITFGPAIEDGFYYDFQREQAFTPDDFEKIENKMREIIDSDTPFIREVWARQEAIDYFTKAGEHFKAEHIQSLPENEIITIYKQGAWLDLCRGPHLVSTGKIGKAFKLMKLSGAYWKGDANNPQLQRIYATCWRNEKELKTYLFRLEEAKKRDHRKLGQEMNLFHTQEEAAGSIFWHENGWILYRLLEQYIRDRLEQRDYREVKTPQLVNSELWKKSGHWQKFREDMFTISESENPERVFALKPMNCPCHIQIFNQNITSYKDLPVRISEFGQVFRNEASGALHGLMRVRSFTQDDGHIFCTEEQIVEETKSFCELLQLVYQDCGFTDISIKFSDRPETRAGSDEVWDRAENALRIATESAKLPYTMNPGEGAFYGPKLEFVLKDTLGREWQCGTLQVDFVLPERLGATYIDSDSKKKHPVLLHRAIFGSIERFIGILIENHAGKFPFWLAPVQIVVMAITNDLDDYGMEIFQQFEKAGLRVRHDFRNEKLNYKIREHSHKKVPVIAICGKKEATNNEVSLRYLGQEQQETLKIEQAVKQLAAKSVFPTKAQNNKRID